MLCLSNKKYNFQLLPILIWMSAYGLFHVDCNNKDKIVHYIVEGLKVIISKLF